MKAHEIIKILDDFAPSGIQEDWDNSGLSVGNKNVEVNSAILSLDCTEEVVQEAIDCGANMIITHHPLIFKGVKKITNESVLERVIIKAVKNDLIIYSMHTNIDKVMSGVSGKMAQRLGLVDVVFLSKDSSEEYGMGVVGNLPSPMTYIELVIRLKEVFNLNSVRCSKPLNALVKRVALCGGSGTSLIDEARNSGADVFITGDITYHHFFTEDGFGIMDIGHYESETGVLEVIKDILLKKLPTFAVRIAAKNINPIHYF
jgi:dinuclear metal center YbgI/SA1388 family protein